MCCIKPLVLTRLLVVLSDSLQCLLLLQPAAKKTPELNRGLMVATDRQHRQCTNAGLERHHAQCCPVFFLCLTLPDCAGQR